MKYEDNPKSIKYYIKRFLLKNKERFSGKIIVDFPAGNGITSRIIKEIGALPISFDLFPEYFRVEGIECKRVNIVSGIPLEDKFADALICQEGIEHFPDQLSALKEFNRVIKAEGILLITTPNYSNLRAKLSYLLSESERFNSIMPPNELDSIWKAEHAISDELYYGHIFLIGIQKLRVLAKLSGFRIKEIHFTRTTSTSMLLFPLYYPFILLSNYITYLRNMRVNKDHPIEIKRMVYKEIFRLAISPKILTGADLMVELKKEMDSTEVGKTYSGSHRGFGLT